MESSRGGANGCCTSSERQRCRGKDIYMFSLGTQHFGGNISQLFSINIIFLKSYGEDQILRYMDIPPYFSTSLLREVAVLLREVAVLLREITFCDFLVPE